MCKIIGSRLDLRMGDKTINDELIDHWLMYISNNKSRSPKTVIKYRKYLNLLAKSHELLDVTRNHLELFTGAELHNAGYSRSSRRIAVAAIRGFYQYCFNHQLIDRNPADELPYPPQSRSLPDSLGLKNAEALLRQPDLQTLTGARDAAILGILIGCGLRVSGICSLNISNLVVYEHNGQERWAIKVSEKGEHQRQVPVPNESMLLLQIYLGHKELTSIDRRLPNGDQVLFISTSNTSVAAIDYIGESRRLSTRSIDKMIKKYAVKAGVPEHLAHAHAMRHLVGQEMAEESLTEIEIMSLLGHANVDTSAIYTHIANRKRTELVDKSNPLSKINTPVSKLLSAL